jgi:hypothetical protein
MLTLKHRTLTFVILTLLGCGYFSGISHLEVNEFLKSEVALIPIQLVVAIYITYLRWSRHGDSAELDN